MSRTQLVSVSSFARAEEKAGDSHDRAIHSDDFRCCDGLAGTRSPSRASRPVTSSSEARARVLHNTAARTVRPSSPTYSPGTRSSIRTGSRPTKLTHINYAFANIADGKIIEGFANDAKNFEILSGLRTRTSRI